jgi:hypothetical protein
LQAKEQQRRQPSQALDLRRERQKQQQAKFARR